MKKILFLLFLNLSISYSQTIEGIITVSPLKSVGDETSLSEKAKGTIYYNYIYSNQISKQELISKTNTSIDTILVDDRGLNDLPSEKIEVIIKAHKAVHYKNYAINIYRLENERLDENLSKKNTSIKDTIPYYQWSFINESQTVAGYKCKKATTLKSIGNLQTITAWYCEDIPINDGPMDFSGLPGLILQIEIGNNTLVKFENLKFLNNKETFIKEPINVTEMITISEYVKRLNGG